MRPTTTPSWAEARGTSGDTRQAATINIASQDHFFRISIPLLLVICRHCNCIDTHNQADCSGPLCRFVGAPLELPLRLALQAQPEERTPCGCVLLAAAQSPYGLRRRQALYENLSTTGLFLIVIVVVFPVPSGARSSPPVVVPPRMIVGSPVSIMVGSPVSI